MMEFLKEIGFIKEWGDHIGIPGFVFGIFLIIILAILGIKRYTRLNKEYTFKIYITITILLFVFAITSLVLSYSESSYYLTVFVHEGNRGDNLILTNRGKVRLIYEGADPTETINDKGVATFKQIPSIFFNSKKPIKIHFFDPQNEPYKAINPDSIYYLT